MSKSVNYPAKANYSRNELKLHSEARRRIAALTGEEWAEEWDRVTKRLRKGIKK